jgi:hypothetical protein
VRDPELLSEFDLIPDNFAKLVVPLTGILTMELARRYRCQRIVSTGHGDRLTNWCVVSDVGR